MADPNFPLVSVIIPCYNVEDYIQRSVMAVVHQDYPWIELICVNNNSTDDTLIILEELKLKYPKLVILHEPRKGAPFARNTGWRNSNGSWIQFLDADDFIERNKISHQIGQLVEKKLLKPGYFVAGNEYWIRSNGAAIEFHKFSFDPWRDLISGTLGDTCSNLWNKTDLENIGGWNEERLSSQEQDLMFRLLKNGSKVIYDSEPLTKTFERGIGSISAGIPLQNIERVIRQRLEIRQYLNLELHENKYDALINFRIFNNLISAYLINRKESVRLIDYVKREGFSLSRIEGVGIIRRTYGRIFGIENLLRLYRLTNLGRK